MDKEDLEKMKKIFTDCANIMDEMMNTADEDTIEELWVKLAVKLSKLQKI